MKTLLLFVLVFALHFSICGQTTKADIEQLRKVVNLPSSTSITTEDVGFPNLKPIKIYLAIKHNKDAAKDFNNWVARWNKTNANQFGQIQIVDNLSDADIAAVQYQFGTTRLVREESAQVKIGKGQREINSDDDKFVLQGIGNSKARVESSVRSLKLPLYSYLIVRGQNSSWIIDYSQVDERISNKNFPELLLQSAIEDRLRNR